MYAYGCEEGWGAEGAKPIGGAVEDSPSVPRVARNGSSEPARMQTGPALSVAWRSGDVGTECARCGLTCDEVSWLLHEGAVPITLHNGRAGASASAVSSGLWRQSLGACMPSTSAVPFV